jgi:uncharacterized membrane protein YdbT with pleckstrin-like domain
LKSPSEPGWSLRSSAVNGGLAGIALAALHQVYSAIAGNIPDNIYAHVIGDFVAGAVGGAILFVAIAALRNHRKGRG